MNCRPPPLLLSILALASPGLCAQETRPTRPSSGPSDKAAVDLARAVLAAMGGEGELAKLKCLRFVFLGKRSHVWDRSGGRHRVQWKEPGDEEQEEVDVVVVRDLRSGTGRASVAGVEVQDAARLAQLLAAADAAFVNDTYWLLFPVKLLDPGVRLRLLPPEDIEGKTCDVLSVSFQGVGRTPQNEYLACVDRRSGLIVRWTYFEDPGSEGLTWNWGPYERVGGFLLAGRHKAVGHDRDVDVTRIESLDPCDDALFELR
jgi:hypothetical protein